MHLSVFPSHSLAGLDVLMVLPPDFDAPLINKRFRFPPQGPALVAAAIGEAGAHVRLVDLELSEALSPVSGDTRLLDSDVLVDHLLGRPSDSLAALADGLLRRIDEPRCDALAFSLDRHTQIRIACLLAYEAKQRWGAPVLLGGANAVPARKWLIEKGICGIDLATYASTPQEIRAAFSALRELSRGRKEPVAEPLGQRMLAAPDEWPIADFSIYDLEQYRADPFRALPEELGGYDGSQPPMLVLPYHFTYDCQYVCTFCQRGGTQSAKSMDCVVRDLAALSERYETREILLFDTQVNLYAEDFARALIEARLDLRWSNSYRVRPSRPGALSLLAESGCVGLTIGVESASEKMLRKTIKGHLAWHATRMLREAHDCEIMTRVNLLPCFPGETREDFLETRDWLEENARIIDDIAPSSFYLAEGSPVGQEPEKFGLRIRNRRLLMGDHKFRKNLGSLEYDEVDGMTWEERSSTLRPAEDELRQAWERGRGARGRIKFLTSAMIFAMRRAFPTKGEAYDAMLRWWGPPPPRPPRIVAPKDPPAPLSSRFDAVIEEAMPSLTRYLGRDLEGHMILFDDGDYVCFRGRVNASEEPSQPPETLFIESILATRLTPSSRRKRVYGKLRPGALVRVSAGALMGAMEGDPWEERLRHGMEFHVLSFASGQEKAPR